MIGGIRVPLVADNYPSGLFLSQFVADRARLRQSERHCAHIWASLGAPLEQHPLASGPTAPKDNIARPKSGGRLPRFPGLEPQQPKRGRIAHRAVVTS
jgi:hypothetical protein